MHATHTLLASAVAVHGGKSWWNRPMVWASLAAIGYGGWLAARRAQRRAEREEAEDAADAQLPTAVGQQFDSSPMDEAMNRLGRDWHPEEPTPPAQ